MPPAEFLERLPGLLQEAQRLAVPPISDFRVGAALLGASGRVYLGFNLEFPGQALHHTVHAEQCALSMAQTCGETGISALAVTAAPCGHCRQFLNEVWEGQRLPIFIGPEKIALDELLPRSFGPRDLQVEYGLLNSPSWDFSLETEDPLARVALESARRSYAPYSGCAAGLALETTDGRTFRGSYAENAAFNPSFPPLQAALCHLICEGGRLDQIARAVLVQRSSLASLEPSTRTLLRGLAPQAEFLVLSAEPG